MSHRDCDYNEDRNFHSLQHINLIRVIEECEAMCEHMTTIIKRKYDTNERELQSRLLRDCADICGLTSKYISRRSVFSRMIAGLCATICQTCGQECAKFPDRESQECARMCFHCARECHVFAMGGY